MSFFDDSPLGPLRSTGRAGSSSSSSFRGFGAVLEAGLTEEATFNGSATDMSDAQLTRIKHRPIQLTSK
jgi:hypothetical protein